MPNSHNVKLIKAGPIIKLVTYENEVWRDFKTGDRNTDREVSEEEKLYNRKRYLKQAMDNFIGLVQANHHHWRSFYTLTFDESIVTHDPQSVTESNEQFKRFIDRLKYYYGKDVRYMAVVEFQKNDNVHYHVIFDRYIDIWQMQNDIWKMGICHANRVQGVTNLGRYMAKYMTKDLGDNRLRNNKAYFRSRNLDKPKEYINPTSDLINQYTGNMQATKEVEFDTEHKGKIKIMEFDTNKLKE